MFSFLLSRLSRICYYKLFRMEYLKRRNIVPLPIYKNRKWKGASSILSEGYFKVGEKLFNTFKDYPDTIGQIDGKTEEKETFGSMGKRVISCALWLQKQGIKKGDVISFCSGNHLDSWIPMIASLYIGAIFNPWWEVNLNEDLVTYFFELSQPKIMFVNEKLADTIINSMKNCKKKIKVIFFGKQHGFESFRDILEKQDMEEIEKFQCVKISKPEDPAMMLYTSGTTSYPKGVLYSYGSLVHVGYLDSKLFILNTINLWFTGLSWTSGVSATLQSILTRSTMVLYDGVTEEQACKLIEKYKISWITMGTHNASRLWKTKSATQYDVSSVLRVGYGGAPMKKEVAIFLLGFFKNASNICAYGSTEVGIATAGKMNLEKPTSCGKVFLNAEIKVVDLETEEIVGPDTKGEICFRGPSLMPCYWKNPVATEDTIDSEGWYHTGDLGYYDADGDFFVIERIQELIEYHSDYLLPTLLEWVIQDHPGVAEVGVVAKPSQNDVEQLIAFITKLPGTQIKEREIHELIRSELKNHQDLTVRIRFLNIMPHTAGGKILRSKLQTMARLH